MNEDLRITSNQVQETLTGAVEYIVIETPIPARRALTQRRPLAVALGSGATVMAIWFLAVIGSAGSIAGVAGVPLVLVPGGAAATQHDNSANAPQVTQQDTSQVVIDLQARKVSAPPLLQSRSAETLPALSTRPDGRTALNGSPTVLMIYVPYNYYPQPAAALPPTKEAVQQASTIVQQIASANETKAVEPAKALQAAQPQYAAQLAAEIQKAAEPSPRYNVVRQVLVELDPSLQTHIQVVPQTRAETQTQVQVDTQTQAQTQQQTATTVQQQTDQANALPSKATGTDQERAARVNALVMATVPAYLKIPMGMNEGTLQVNTMVAPTPAFLFDQAQIRSALCEVGSGDVVAVNDTIPDAWELKATFIPKDPVRWFTVRDAGGKLFYLPNYLDAVREVQVGDQFVNHGGCNVELVKK
jgi:hypothetical protein